MGWAELLAFNIAYLGVVASPGPAFVAVTRTALARGRADGLRCALGLGLGAVFWSLLAILGLTALFAVAPWAFWALKIGGALYLAWLAWSLWRNADTPIADGEPRGLGGIQLGILTNLANPKAVVFVAAIFTTIFAELPSGGSALLVLANQLAIEVVWYAAIALVMTTAPARAAYLRLKAVLDRIAAGVLTLLALRTAT